VMISAVNVYAKVVVYSRVRLKNAFLSSDSNTFSTEPDIVKESAVAYVWLEFLSV